MFGLGPWGGRGANPLLKRFQKIWDQSKHILSGGMPYSEGKYEDISKIQFAGYYWDKDRHYTDIMAEYINYYYSSDVVDEVIEFMELIEKNHVLVHEKNDPDMEASKRAYELAKLVDDKLSEEAKTDWRWRILYIRARIDLLIYTYYDEKGRYEEDGLAQLRRSKEEWLADDEEAQDLLQELCAYYH